LNQCVSSRKTNRDSIPLPDDHHDGHKVDALAQKVHSPDMEPTEGEDDRLEEKENIRLRRRIASLEQILRDNKIDFEDALRQDAHQGRENDIGTEDALVGLYMLANTKATAVQQPQPALLNSLSLRPLQTERPFNKSKSAPPAETEKIQKYQATMWEMGKQRAQAMEYVPDYFSLPLQAHYAGEENPFETSFGAKGNVESETPGGTKLPSVAALTSPDSGFKQRSLRSGPLSPSMLSGPRKTRFQGPSALSLAKDYLLPRTVWI
jgi:hypothetical protein